MKWLRWFFREWGKRCVRQFAGWLVFGPIVIFVLHANDDRIDTPGEWIWALVAVLLPVVFGKWLWHLQFDDEEKAVPPTPAELRRARLEAVADSVDQLPHGISFTALCEQLDERQTRRLLHLLHQTRPGERHLRDVLKKHE